MTSTIAMESLIAVRFPGTKNNEVISHHIETLHSYARFNCIYHNPAVIRIQGDKSCINMSDVILYLPDLQWRFFYGDMYFLLSFVS